MSCCFLVTCKGQSNILKDIDSYVTSDCSWKHIIIIIICTYAITPQVIKCQFCAII